ncbi:MAG: hypothetical protein R2850_06110 [Bacteroidia bacterium]
MLRSHILLFFFPFFISGIIQQVNAQTLSQPGWFSLGARSTLSAFSHDGNGLGAGGQFRIRFSNQVNSDWFADYISISTDDGIKSIYYHIGWSVLYYPVKDSDHPQLIQPYILAGHCFDYNEKSQISLPSNKLSRWGSAVQTGLGLHFNLSPAFDISVMSQYMIHLTKEIEGERENDGVYVFKKHQERGLEGHLLNTISVNYKLFRLWK